MGNRASSSSFLCIGLVSFVTLWLVAILSRIPFSVYPSANLMLHSSSTKLQNAKFCSCKTFTVIFLTVLIST